jgi:iron complex outermembrane receptor protein
MNTRTTHRIGLSSRIAVLIGAMTAVFAAVPAFAQQTGAGEPSLALEEIVVTAEKRSENIQNAPSAITSVSGDELTAAGAVDVREMADLFPSSRFEEIWGWAHLYVRGIGAEQDRISVDQLVNMFMDGVVLPREINSVSQSDVDAIELLPGPQGTLYGASSIGGVLNIRNNRPAHDDDNSLMVEAGNYASLHIRDVQDIDVDNDLALRAMKARTAGPPIRPRRGCRHCGHRTIRSRPTSGGWFTTTTVNRRKPRSGTRKATGFPATVIRGTSPPPTTARPSPATVRLTHRHRVTTIRSAMTISSPASSTGIWTG